MTPFSRRNFLQTAVVLAGGGLSAFQAKAADPPAKLKRKFTMDLSPGMVGVKVPLRKVIDLAAQFGFESVAPAVDALAALSDGELQELLAAMKAKRLVWGATGMNVDFRHDESKFAGGMKKLPAWAKSAARAGVVRVNTWVVSSHESLTYLANFRLHVKRLREMAKVLGDHGLRFGLEYVGPTTSLTSLRYPFLHTMAEMKELIAEIGQPHVGFLLDSWHWYTAGETVADLLTLTNQDVVSCHLNDAPVGVSREQQQDKIREMPAATGIIDLKAFLGALVQIGYDGPVAAEPFSKSLRTMPAEQAVQTVAAAMKKAFALVE